MRSLLRIVVLLLLVLPLALVVAVYMSVQDQPLVSRAGELTPRDVAKVKEIMKEHDPRKMEAGTVRTVSVSQWELDRVTNYLLNRFGNGSSSIKLDRGRLILLATVKLPANPVGRFLNLDTALLETSSLPRFRHLRIGRVPIPSWLANVLFTRGLDALYANADYPRATDVIKGVVLADGHLRVTYQWQPGLVEQVRSRVVAEGDRERLKVFHEHLAEVSRWEVTGRSMSLASLMGSLFQLAYQRSGDGDAVANNRAAIIVLAAYVNGSGLTTVVPAAEEWSQPARRKVTLQGRKDLAQHFMTSAALAVTGGGSLSDAVGLYKEVDDSRGGSGFSFGDLAADRAGTRFGELATQSLTTALKVQKGINGALREADFMPTVGDLPEFMSEAEFNRRFGGLDSPAYNRMTRDIDRRIAACTLYQ